MRPYRTIAIAAVAVLMAGIGQAALADEPHEALAEVNAQRRARGLRPFICDEGLTIAAEGAAKFRADRLIEAHTQNDFRFLPRGVKADAAGCAAWPKGSGFGSCCIYDNYRYCGAAYCYGRNGLRFMHVFVRY